MTATAENTKAVSRQVTRLRSIEAIKLLPRAARRGTPSGPMLDTQRTRPKVRS